MKLRTILWATLLAAPLALGRASAEAEAPGYGGGLWFTVLKPQNSISITAARDPDARGADRAWRIYFNAGFAF